MIFHPPDHPAEAADLARKDWAKNRGKKTAVLGNTKQKYQAKSSLSVNPPSNAFIHKGGASPAQWGLT